MSMNAQNLANEINKLSNNTITISSQNQNYLEFEFKNEKYRVIEDTVNSNFVRIAYQSPLNTNYNAGFLTIYFELDNGTWKFNAVELYYKGEPHTPQQNVLIDSLSSSSIDMVLSFFEKMASNATSAYMAQRGSAAQ